MRKVPVPLLKGRLSISSDDLRSLSTSMSHIPVPLGRLLGIWGMASASERKRHSLSRTACSARARPRHVDDQDLNGRENGQPHEECGRRQCRAAAWLSRTVQAVEERPVAARPGPMPPYQEQRRTAMRDGGRHSARSKGRGPGKRVGPLPHSQLAMSHSLASL